MLIHPKASKKNESCPFGGIHLTPACRWIRAPHAWFFTDHFSAVSPSSHIQLPLEGQLVPGKNRVCVGWYWLTWDNASVTHYWQWRLSFVCRNCVIATWTVISHCFLCPYWSLWHLSIRKSVILPRFLGSGCMFAKANLCL